MCEGICPVQCIQMQNKAGMFQPVLGKECTSCGMCLNVCPGIGKRIDAEKTDELIVDDLTGSCISAYKAFSKDEYIRSRGASGGVLTTLLYRLLKQKAYDVAFVVNDLSYGDYVKTVAITSDNAELLLEQSETKSSSGSRYVPIGHGDAVRFMLSNPDSRIIITGTPCAIKGFLSVIESRKLNRDNYLLIGLFCGSVMTYRVWDYFSQNKFTHGKELSAFHFRNKEYKGWPGDIKMSFADHTHSFLERLNRIEIKDYFKAERCIYCTDKLNINADISLGDDYTEGDSDKLGANSVIIRTDRGASAWEKCAEFISYSDDDAGKIAASQKVKRNCINQVYADRKEKEIFAASGMRFDINAMGKCGREDEKNDKYSDVMEHLEMGRGSFDRINSKLALKHFKKKIAGIVKRH